MRDIRSGHPVRHFITGAQRIVIGFSIRQHEDRVVQAVIPNVMRVRLSRACAEKLRLASLALLAFLAFVSSSVAIAAEYKLQPGDILEFSVAGISELRQRLTVGIDGDVSVPLVGDIHAAGQTLAEVRDKIREQVPKMALNMRTATGGEQQTVIAGNEISLNIAEFRPIYITGDVAKPGEQRFTPGLTVRQAVSLAGGYDLQRFRMDNPILQTAELRSDYENLNIELAQGLAATARLKAELDGRKTLDKAFPEQIPIPASVKQDILKNEQEYLTSRSADFEKEKTHLRASLKITEDRLTSIQDQFQKETEAAKLDFEEIDRISELNKRGIVPLTRAVETRRLSLNTATRALQSGVEVERAKRDRAEAARSLDRLADQRRSDLLRDLQDISGKVAQTRAKLASVGEKLLYTGVVRSQLVRGSGGQPDIRVHRVASGDAKAETLTGDENTPLQPGDTVEVALKVAYEFKPSAETPGSGEAR